MANVRDRHLGSVQGKIGDQVFKMRGTKSYVAQLPHNGTGEAKDVVINNRKRFGKAARFSLAVNQITPLKTIWDIYTPNSMSPFNGIVKTNYQHATASDVLDSALIVPFFGGFPVVTTDVSVDGLTVTVAIDPIGTGEEIDTTIEKFISLCAVTKCTDKNVDTIEEMKFISLQSANVVLNLANPLSFEITLTGAERKAYSSYDTHLTYLALVTLDDSGNAIHFSESFTS